jgi:hypothetical protein
MDVAGYLLLFKSTFRRLTVISKQFIEPSAVTLTVTVEGAVAF